MKRFARRLHGDSEVQRGTGIDTTGDRSDRIEDTDARGFIVVNDQLLVGGVKRYDRLIASASMARSRTTYLERIWS
jgi:hypothetical protein